MIIFATEKYTDMAKTIAKGLKGSKLGDLERKTFPDGERYLRIKSTVKNKEVVIVGGTYSDAATMEIYDLSCALVKYGAKKLTLVIPYFGYSTMERAIKTGEVVGAKTRARLLSAIPQASEGNEIYLMDLHSEGIPYYFEGSTKVFHLYAKEAVFSLIKKMVKGNNFVLASTDAGRAKWVQSLANELEVVPAFVYKKRISGDTTEVVGVNADVMGKDVIIYDDMIRTGGSLINAAKAYKAAGAKKIYAIATHGILPGDSLNKLTDSGLFSKIGITDSYPHGQEKSSSLLIESVVKTLIQGLRS